MIATYYDKDGKIIDTKDDLTTNEQVKEYAKELMTKHNIESITYVTGHECTIKKVK